jgi:uracil-DNA glycosylase
MIWENFKDLFHESWHKKIQPWVESEDCDKVYTFLKKESRRGKKIAPLASNVFKAFQLTPFDQLKVVFMGLSPYHTFKHGTPVTDGLLMSCSVTGRLQPSLEKFYEAIEKEIYDGLSLHIIKDPDLTYLAQQGVLLTNASLTVEMNKPGSHLKIWEPFIQYLLSEVLFGTGVPIVFLGREAGKYERWVAPFTHRFVLTHPASASYSDMDWKSEGVFKKINKILKDSNGEEIEWIKKIE